MLSQLGTYLWYISIYTCVTHGSQTLELTHSEYCKFMNLAVLSMADSQNPTVPAALRRRYSILWQKAKNPPLYIHRKS